MPGARADAEFVDEEELIRERAEQRRKAEETGRALDEKLAGL